MRRSVEVSQAARQDLIDTIAYLTAENWRAAQSVEARLTSAMAELASRAEQFPVVADRASRGICRRVVGSYNIFYEIRGARVVILRVLHGARDASRLMDGDED
ncbi:type II toxin-antitoxin system RelE/ParE family toxin [Devosia sp.]|uniref:type II toxin-antitoxin system RelE/ParE family toxin n=1 Tax=Devosia sp. TaxID=1871048 RepID=UPI003A945FCB